MPIKQKKAERQQETISHINRIQGQLEGLKTYIKSGKGCLEVASLTTAIAKSFDSLRVRTLEGAILFDILEDTTLPAAKRQTLAKVISLHKK
ncbi:hypothetical protein A3J91_02665 [Candidatus Peribacteria bacterium RIFOXYC2_FULL_58_10]|nr:MAG: hypothetical protein A3J91_02665 [Candidatus Peribacteria bacterium RIFOXYC2_FULL_58_10]OGJ85229.1 MAG: hypothetical protein A2529_02070 [Candidatus Peribacteria bacterium RIFOXYD2_FULL_58_15]